MHWPNSSQCLVKFTNSVAAQTIIFVPVPQKLVLSTNICVLSMMFAATRTYNRVEPFQKVGHCNYLERHYAHLDSIHDLSLVCCTNYLASSCASNVFGLNCLWFGWINSSAGWYLSDDSGGNLWLVTATNSWIVSTAAAWHLLFVSATIIFVLVNVLSVSTTLWWLKPHHCRLGLPSNSWHQIADCVP